MTRAPARTRQALLAPTGGCWHVEMRGDAPSLTSLAVAFLVATGFAFVLLELLKSLVRGPSPRGGAAPGRSPARARARAPRVSRAAKKLLADARPPTREELERYVPQQYRDLGREWGYTVGKVLEASERAKTTTVYSVAGFDVDRGVEETSTEYLGV